MHCMSKMRNLLQMNDTNKQFLALFATTLLVIASIIITNIKPLSKSDDIDEQPAKKATSIETVEQGQIIKNNKGLDKIKQELKDAGITPREAKYWKNL